MQLVRTAGTLTLMHRRSDLQRRMGYVYIAAMAALSLGVAVVVVTSAGSVSLPTALVLGAGLVIAGMNVQEALHDGDVETSLDTETRTITRRHTSLVKSSIETVRFEDVASLAAEEGYVGRSRCLVVWLRLRDGRELRLAHDHIWASGAAASEAPALVAEIRVATGLPAPAPRLAG